MTWASKPETPGYYWIRWRKGMGHTQDPMIVWIAPEHIVEDRYSPEYWECAGPIPVPEEFREYCEPDDPDELGA